MNRVAWPNPELHGLHASASDGLDAMDNKAGLAVVGGLDDSIDAHGRIAW